MCFDVFYFGKMIMGGLVSNSPKGYNIICVASNIIKLNIAS